jgi:lambda repressor-like predicted transcriptional regulator
MAERLYDLPTEERDRIIADLRAKGWTLQQIGHRVGMSRSGVSRALDRLENG